MRTYKQNMPTLRLKSDISTVYCKFELLSEEECQSYGIQEVYKIRWNIHGHIPYATTGYSFMGAIGHLLKLIKEVLKDDEIDYYFYVKGKSAQWNCAVIWKIPVKIG